MYNNFDDKSARVLVLWGNRSLTEPMLTQIYIAATRKERGGEGSIVLYYEITPWGVSNM